MAVVPVKEQSSVKIKLNTGTDLNSQVEYRTKTLSSIKATATDDDIAAVVNGLVALQAHTLEKITRVDNTELQL